MTCAAACPIAFNTRAYPKNQEVLTSLLKTRYQIATLLGYSLLGGLQRRRQDDRQGAQHRRLYPAGRRCRAPAGPARVRNAARRKAEDHPRRNEIWDHERSYLCGTGAPLADTISIPNPCALTFPLCRSSRASSTPRPNSFTSAFSRSRTCPRGIPAVETWIVIDHGKPIGRFYLDMHPRPGKYSHAEMVPVLDGVRGKQLPEAILVCNFPAPTAERSRPDGLRRRARLSSTNSAT